MFEDQGVQAGSGDVNGKVLGYVTVTLRIVEALRRLKSIE
jgi:hypothetical protein